MKEIESMENRISREHKVYKRFSQLLLNFHLHNFINVSIPEKLVFTLFRLFEIYVHFLYFSFTKNAEACFDGKKEQ